MRLAMVTLAVGLLAGCASNDRPPERDGGMSPMDGMVQPDTSMMGCRADQHMCPSGCEDDRPNRPDMGCRLGCGDACPTPPNAQAICTDEGVCGAECIAPAVMGPDGCTCPAVTCEDLGFTCGMASDMCGGQLDCGMCGAGASCVDNQCGCTPDAAETNDSRASAFSLGALDDSSDETQMFNEYSIHNSMDEDWYEYAVTDGSDGGNPSIRIDLRDIPEGANYDLFAWYVCSTGTDATGCGAGAPDATIGAGCRTESTGNTSETVRLDTDCEHFGFDDSGTLYIRIVPTGTSAACTPYTMIVQIN